MLTPKDIERLAGTLERRDRLLMALRGLGWSYQQVADRTGYALPTIKNAMSNMQDGVYRERVFDAVEELIQEEITLTT